MFCIALVINKKPNTKLLLTKKKRKKATTLQYYCCKNARGRGNPVFYKVICNVYMCRWMPTVVQGGTPSVEETHESCLLNLGNGAKDNTRRNRWAVVNDMSDRKYTL